MVSLTKAEEKIMKILWNIGEGFIKDIIEQYPGSKPPYTSVSTIMRVLVKKKIVAFKVYGNSHQYYPLITKEKYSRGQLARLVKDYFNNSLTQVINAISGSINLNENELDKVIKTFEDLKNHNSR